MVTFLRLLLIITCLLLLDVSSQAQCPACRYESNNVIVNGNFESGASGFSSEYTRQNDLFPEGTYQVGRNPNDYHSNFRGNDHTTGTGRFMIVNGAPTPGVRVWCQTINVVPNTDYVFSTWVCSVHPTAPALLQFSINGVQLGNVFQAPNAQYVWQEFYVNWNSGANTTAQICIVNQSTIRSGNDFGLDDINFTPCLPYNTSSPSAGPDQTACGSLSTVIGPAPITNRSYAWSPATDLSNPNISRPTLNIVNTGSTPITRTYVLTSDSANLGCISRDTVTFTVNPIPTFDIADVRVCNQSVDLNSPISGGTYLWNTGATTSGITTSITGKYWLRVTKFGCSYTDTINVIIDTVPSFNLPSLVKICQGGDSVLSAAPLVGLWSTGVTASSITVNSAGTYWLRVSNGTCVVSDTVQVSILPYPVTELGPDQLSCTGGSFTLNAGQVGTWQDGTVAATYTASTTGKYWVNVYNEQCKSSDTVNVTIENVSPIDLGGPYNFCEDSAITLSVVQSGTPSYLWSTGATTPTISVNQAGKYWLRVTKGLCSLSDTAIVNIDQLPVTSLLDSVKICEGTSATFTTTTNPAYTYLWNTGATTNSITASIAGNYSVTVTNGTCSLVDSTNLRVVAVPVVSLPASSTICETDSVLLQSTANASYTHNWSNSYVGTSQYVKAAGNYTLTVVNDICQASANAIVIVDELPVTSLLDSVKICDGTSATFTTTSNPAYTYLWNTGATTNSITASNAGNYSVTVTNGTCSLVDSTNLKVVAVPVLTLPASTTICETDSVLLQSSANSSYTHNWSNGFIGTSQYIKAAGTYTLTVVNDICQASASAVVIVDQLPVTSLLDSVKICEGTSATFTTIANPAYTYLWNTGATTNSITASIAGNYSVTVTNGTCSVIDSTNLKVVAVPVVSLPASSTICETDSVLLQSSANSSYTHNWSNGFVGTSQYVRAAGTYTLTVVNDICQASASAIVIVDQLPLTSLLDSVKICEGTSATFTTTSNPAYTYLWNTGATSNSITASAAGNYSVIVSNGTCSLVDSTNLKVVAVPVVTLPASSAFCETDSVLLQSSANSSYTHNWSNGFIGTSQYVRAAGTYTLTVVNDICQASANAVVIVDELPLTSLLDSVKICEGAAATLTTTANPAYTYLWNTGAITNSITASSAGNYSVAVTNGTCSLLDSTNLKVVAVPVVTLPASTTICVTDSVLLQSTADAAYTHNWSNGFIGTSQYVNAAGTYTLTVVNDICQASASAIVIVDELPVTSLLDSVKICEGTSATFTTTTNPAYTYLWNTGATVNSITASAAGNYSVTVTNGTCSLVDSTNLTIVAVPVVTLPASTTICETDSVLLQSTADASYTHNWSNGFIGTSQYVKAAGTYTLTVVNDICQASASAVVIVDQLPVTSLLDSVKICEGTSATFTTTANPAYTYLWSTGATTNSISASAAGSYSVVVTNGTCSLVDSSNLKVVAVPVVTLPASTTICETDSVLLQSTADASYTHNWSNAFVGTSQYVRAAGTYTLTVVNDICQASASAVVIVDELPVTSLLDSVKICDGTSATFTTTTNPAYTYLWNTGATTNSISASTAGNYSVVVSNGTCSLVDSTNLRVVAVPVVTLPASTTICETDSVLLQSTTDASYTHHWSNGFVGTTQYVRAAGTYTLIVVNDVCQASANAVVIVDQLPLTSLLDSVKICDGTSATFTTTTNPAYTYLWNTGATTNSISASAAGSYSVVVSNGTCSLVDSSNLKVVAVPVVTLPASTTICETDSVLLQSTADASYTHNWSNAFVGTSQYVRAAGTYTLTVINDICQASASAVVIVDQLPLTSLLDSVKICEGTSATFTTTLNPAYTYLWNTGATANSITTSAAGNYSVTVSNGTCSLADSTNLKVVAVPVVTLPASTTICETDSVLLQSNANPSYVHNWSNGFVGTAQYVRAAGTYTLTVVNDICQASANAIVIVDELPLTSLLDSVKICEGSSATFTTTSNPAYTYLWNTGAITNSITASSAGNYSVVVTNGTCSLADSTNLTIVAVPVVSLPASTTICETDSVLLQSSADLSYIHNWSNGFIGTSQYVKAAGTYTLTVVNDICQASASAIVIVDELPVIILLDSVKICEGAAATFTTTANPAYTYLWNTGSTANSITASAAGNYSVTVSNGTCSLADSTNLTIVAVPVVTIPASATICETDSVLLQSSANASYTHNWSNGFVGTSQYVRAAGTYTLTVVNDICQASANAVVIVDQLPVTSLLDSVKICEGSSATFTTISNPAYTYLWNTSATNNSITTSSAGNYSVVVSNGTCSLADSTNLKVVAVPVVTLPASTTICETDSVLLQSSADLSYTHNWSNGFIGTSQYVRTAGTYTLTVVNDICQASASAVVIVDQLPVTSLLDSVKICEGASATFTTSANPAYTYLWNTGATANSITASAAGNYSVVVSNGTCSLVDSTNLKVVAVPVVTLPASTTICKTDSVLLQSTADASYTHNWSNAFVGTSQYVRAAGTYTLTVINDICQASASAIVIVDELPVTSLLDSVRICEGAAATFTTTANPAYTYLWNTGATSNSITASNAGNYSVTVTNGTCSLVDSTNLKVVAVPVVTLPASTTICETDSVLLQSTADASYTHNWSNGFVGTAQYVRAAGTYTLIVVNDICQASASAIVIVDELPITSLLDSVKICEGTAATFTTTANPAYTYLWNTGATSNSITALAAGNYSVTVTNGTCSLVDSTYLTIVAVPVVTLPASTTICETDSVLLQSTADLSYIHNWSNGFIGTSQYVKAAGTYTLTVVNDICQASANAIVIVDELPVTSLLDSVKICEGAAATFSTTANPAYTYLWNTGATSNSISASTAGNYSVVVSNGTCSLADSTNLKVVAVPVVSLPASTTICETDSVLLQSSADLSYIHNWSNGFIGTSQYVKAAGTYTLTVANDICQASASAVVIVDELPLTSLLDSVKICEGTSATFTTSANPAYTYLWNTGATTNSISASTAGNYSVVVSNGTCSLVDSTNLRVVAVPVVTLPASTTICETDSVLLQSTTDASYTHNWSNGFIGTSQYVKAAGTYTLTVVNDICQASANAVVIMDELPVTSLLDSIKICEGTSATFTTTTNPAYTYLWNTGATTNSITASNAGNYSLLVTNGTCSLVDSTNLKVIAVPVVTLPAATTICETDSVLLQSTADAAYTHNWSNGFVGTAQYVRAAGTYNLTVVNDICQASANAVVIVDELPSSMLAETVSICENSNISLTANNFTGATILWSTGANTNTITVSQAGIYSVSISNGACTILDSIEVVVDQLPLTSLLDSVKICEGASATFTTTANPAYSYLWNTGATSNSITTSAAGNYSVIVSNGTCSVLDSTHLKVVAVAVLTLPASTTICETDSVLLQSTANPSYVHNWSNGFIGTSQYVRSAGTYTLTVVNDICQASANAVVIVDELPLSTVIPDAHICETQWVVLDATSTATASVLWSTGDTTNQIRTNKAGNYWVEISNGVCKISDTTNIKVDKMPRVDIPDLKVCQGTDTTLYVIFDPAYAYLWNTGSTDPQITINQEGQYSIEVVNGKCLAKDSSYLDVLEYPAANLPAQKTICETDSLFLEVPFNPAYTYTWSNDVKTNQQWVSAAGTYKLIICNDICITNAKTDLATNTVPLSLLVNDIQTCEDQPAVISASATAGADIKWSTGETSNQITVQNSGIYQVKITNGECQLEDSVRVSIDELPELQLPEALKICEGQDTSLSINLNPNYTYTWNNGATTPNLTISQPGLYTVNVNNGACNAKDSTELSVLEQPVLNLPIQNTICANDSFLLSSNANGNFVHQWSNGFNGLSQYIKQAGNYSLTVSNDICQATANTTLVVDELPIAALVNDLAFCENTSATLTATTSGNAQILWSTGDTSNTITVNQPGTYEVNLKNGTCLVNAKAVVKADALPLLQLGESKVCEGQSVSIGTTPIPNYKYLWNTGAQTASITACQAGVYTLMVENGTCKTQDSSELKVLAVPVVQLPALTSICATDSLLLQGDLNSSYVHQWSNGFNGTSQYVKEAGEYELTIINDICQASAKAKLMVDELPLSLLADEVIFCENSSATLSATASPNTSIMWSNGATTPSITVSDAGTYSVSIGNGACLVKDSVLAKIDALPVVELPASMKICAGTDATIAVSQVSNHQYLWSNGANTPSITVSDAGKYSITAKNGTCTATDTTELVVLEIPAIQLPALSTICENDSLLLQGPANPFYVNQWSNGFGGASQYVKEAGIYSLTVLNDICQATAQTELKVDSMPVSILAKDVVFCENASAQLTATTTGSNQVLWSNGATSPSITITQPGSYSVSISNGACVAKDSVVAKVDLLPVVELPAALKICQGSDTSIAVNLQNGYQYLWNTGDTSNQIVLKNAGEYEVNVQNGLCQTKANTILYVLEVPKVSLPELTSICATDSLLLQGDLNSSYVHQWSNGFNGTSQYVKEAGEYELTIINDICQASAKAKLMVDELPLSLLADEVIFCENSSATLSATASPNTSIMWSNGATTPSITVSDAGTYSVSIGNGACLVKDSVLAKIDALPVVELPASMKICAGTDATIAVSQVSNHQYIWSNGATTPSITVSDAGKYSITAKNGTCTATDTTELVVLEIPAIQLPALSTICENDSLLLQGPANPFYVNQWSNGFGGASQYVKEAGIYSLTVLNDICQATVQTELKVDSMPVSILAKDVVFCQNTSAQLTATTTGSNQVLWSNGATSPSITITQPGAYSVSISNGACVAKDSVVAKIDLLPVVELPAALKICQGSDTSIAVNLQNGYQYLWNTGDTSHQIVLKNAGEYEVNVQNGLCQTKANTILYVLEVPKVSLPELTSICATDSLLLQGDLNSSYVHQWSNGFNGTSQYVKEAGEYELTIINDICQASAKAKLMVDELPKSVLIDDIRFCENSSYLLVASSTPNTSLLWSTGDTSNQISVNKAGTYYVQITNGLCVVNDSAVVKTDLLPTFSLPADIELCQGIDTMISVALEGNEFVTWSTGESSPSIRINQSGEYIATVINLTCIASDTININFDEKPIVNLPSLTQICTTDSLVLSGPKKAGYSYLWSNGVNTASQTVKNSGVYILQVFNNACVATDTAILIVDELPVFEAPNPARICEGDSTLLSLGNNSAYTYTWNGENGNSIWVKNSGTYNYSVSNGTCLKTGEIAVLVDQKPIFHLDNQEICSGDSAFVDLPFYPYYIYEWSNGSGKSKEFFTQAGNYSLSIKNGACITSENFDLVVNPLPTIDIQAAKAACFGDSVLIEAKNLEQHLYTWTDANNKVVSNTNKVLSIENNNVDVEKLYYLVVTSPKGCKSKSQAMAKFLSTPQLELGEDIGACADSIRIGTDLNLNTYTWSDGVTGKYRWVNRSGQYQLVVSNGNCTAKDAVNIVINKKPAFDLPADTTICEGALLSLSLPEVAQWSTGYIGKSITVSNAGTYSATISNAYCSTTKEIVVNTDKKPEISFSDVLLCSGSTYTLPQFDNKYNYEWIKGQPENGVIKNPGTYEIVVSNRCGLVKKSFKVNVEECGYTLYFPSAFTPDNDDINDKFYPVHTGLYEVTLMVFNRWGELIYEETGARPGWDGMYQGQLVKTDVYPVKVLGKYRHPISGVITNIEEMGKVTLLK